MGKDSEGRRRRRQSPGRYFTDYSADSELSAALAAEQAYETEGAQDVKPEFVTDLENEGVWQLQDQPNHDDATLTRKFGDET